MKICFYEVFRPFRHAELQVRNNDTDGTRKSIESEVKCGTSLTECKFATHNYTGKKLCSSVVYRNIVKSCLTSCRKAMRVPELGA